MNRETEAGYGAWSAIKGTLPSRLDIRAASEAVSVSDIMQKSLSLSIPESCKDALSIENLFISRYTGAIHLVGRFYSSASSELFTWMKSEYDCRNFLLLLKYFLSAGKGRNTVQMLFKPPIALISPPDPVIIENVDQIISAYDKSYIKSFITDIPDLLTSNISFSCIEINITARRYERLYEAVQLLHNIDRDIIGTFIISELEKLLQNIDDSTAPADIMELNKLFNLIKKNTPSAKRCNPEENLQSAAARFLDLISARSRIRSFCEAIAKAEQQ